MKKEDLIAMGLTEEQADKILSENNKDIQLEQEKTKKFKEDADKLTDMKKELDTLKGKSLTDEEKLQEALDAAQEEKSSYAKKKNKMEIEKLFISAGMKEEDYKDYLEGLVTEDSEGSVKIATSIANSFKASRESTEKQVKADLLKGMKKPYSGDSGDGTVEKTNAEKAAETIAQAMTETSKQSKSVMERYL